MHAAKSQVMSGGNRQPLDSRVPGPERIGNGPSRLESQALSQGVAGSLELGSGLAVGQPREPLVRGGVRGEVEAARLPPPDGVPIEMREAVPRVPHVPRVQASYVVGNEEGGGREPHVGKYWIDVLGEGRVAVIKRQQ